MVSGGLIFRQVIDTCKDIKHSLILNGSRWEIQNSSWDVSRRQHNIVHTWENEQTYYCIIFDTCDLRKILGKGQWGKGWSCDLMKVNSFLPSMSLNLLFGQFPSWSLNYWGNSIDGFLALSRTGQQDPGRCLGLSFIPESLISSTSHSHFFFFFDCRGSTGTLFITYFIMIWGLKNTFFYNLSHLIQLPKGRNFGKFSQVRNRKQGKNMIFAFLLTLLARTIAN